MLKSRWSLVLQAAAGVLVLAAQVLIAGCGSNKIDPRKQVESEYGYGTGILKLLKVDADGNGTVDTFAHMEGARVLQIDIDKGEDGTIDRWEYYGPDQKLAKVGFSRRGDGKQDAWSYFASDGSIARIEISTARNGKINRTEYYERSVLVRAEEDGNGDGRTDKWETFDGARLASVAFDTKHRGTPDRRLVYGADGSVRVEKNLPP